MVFGLSTAVGLSDDSITALDIRKVLLGSGRNSVLGTVWPSAFARPVASYLGAMPTPVREGGHVPLSTDIAIAMSAAPARVLVRG